MGVVETEDLGDPGEVGVAADELADGRSHASNIDDSARSARLERRSGAPRRLSGRGGRPGRGPAPGG